MGGWWEQGMLLLSIIAFLVSYMEFANNLLRLSFVFIRWICVFFFFFSILC